MSVTIVGEKELMRVLKNIPKKSAAKGIRKGTRAGAKIIQGRAKSLAPRASGSIRRHIKVRAMKRSRKRIGAMIALKVTDGARHGAFVALGTKYMEGREFMRLAVDEKKSAAGREAIRIIKSTIEKEAKRG